MEKWFIRNKDVDHLKIAKSLNVNPIISKILVNRDINDNNSIDRFLNYDLKKMYSSHLMKDLKTGGNILKEKIEENKKIRIVGDFDVDGVMSVYVLFKALGYLGADVDYAIPNRVDDGYGINKSIVEKAYNEGVDTIVTCDNGISAIEPIAFAKDLGLTVIVTDHHNPPEVSSNADAIIDPKREDCEYPFKMLCGAAVAFKLIQYLYELFNISTEKAYPLLEYVAIATICDVVDLVDENRTIVKYGLELLNSTKNLGLKALIEETEINKGISVYAVGFIIGPCINASGRIDTAYVALDLFLSQDFNEAKTLAKELKNLNDERKEMTQTGVDLVIENIERNNLLKDKILLIYEGEIHESVAGIIAGRIKDIYYRPTIVLTNGKEGVKGSARSIDEYNIFKGLSLCKELLNGFGGHSMAAGLSLNKDNIDKLRNMLNKNANLTKEDLIPKVYIDMGLPLDYINYKLIEDLKILEPFGKGNPKPLFGEKTLLIKRAFILGKNKNVIKLILESQRGTILEGLIFNDKESFEEKILSKYGEKRLQDIYKGINKDIFIDILYCPSINEYMGKRDLQVIIQNYRF